MTLLNLSGYCGLHRIALDEVRTIHVRQRLWLYELPQELAFRDNAVKELDAIYPLRSKQRRAVR
jgi:hypothetical protein